MSILIVYILAIISCVTSPCVNTSYHTTMCFSKPKQETAKMQKNLLDLKLSDEFEDTCDYLDIDSRNDLTVDNMSLTLMQLNIRGLINKTSLLNQLLIDSIGNVRTDIVLLCKTWLNSSNISRIDIPNYKLIGNVRTGKLGRGTGILIHKSLRCQERKDLDIESF